VTENARTLAATMVGAILGGMAGYFLLTNRGRALRRELEPAIDDFVRELNQFRGTINKAAGIATEGWKLLNETVGDQPAHARYSTPPHQTSPF
jgi:hypothetical protein